MNELEWLVKTSRSVGSKPEFVQGTGGNLSVKLGENMMIKSSGVRMDAVTEGSGWSVVNHGKIAGIYGGGFDETGADSVVASSVAKGGRPSIETGFHSFLGKYIVHLHPVHLNAVLCCKNSAGMLSEIFREEEFLWIPYVKVGHHLAAEIKKRRCDEGIIFLENHGIIASSDDPDECMNIISSVMADVDNYLMSRIPSFKPFSYTAPKQEPGRCASTSDAVLRGSSGIFSGFLFPDAVVFSLSEKIKIDAGGVTYLMDYANAVNIDGVLAAHAHIKENAAKLGTLKYLTESEISDILGMESEK
ncbi:MAG: class II aldolase, partial [Candidatus Aenigmarchaeota archaeon]|nr:class II aldolase [Candidatus Aenigmarchaeota archaeon]